MEGVPSFEATLLQRHGSPNRPLSKGHQSTSIFSGSMYFLGSVPNKLLPRRSVANNVEIHIPVPSDVDSPSFKTSIGTVRYIPDQARLGFGFGGLGLSPIFLLSGSGESELLCS